MTHYLIYPLSIIFTLCFAIYSKWQFSDDRGITQGKWHPWGMIMRVLVFVIAISLSLWPASWQDVLVSLAVSCFVWDIGINLIALHVKALYTGTTAASDIKLSKGKWYLYGVFLAICIAVKIFVK